MMAADVKFFDEDQREVADARGPHFREWIFNVFCWDGLLPVAVIGVPRLVMFLLPGMPQVVVYTIIYTPLVAFVARYWFGCKRLRSGQFYFWQTVVFMIAISLLFLAEAILLINQGIGGMIARWSTVLAMYVAYLVLITIAMFPAQVFLAKRRREAETRTIH